MLCMAKKMFEIIDISRLYNSPEGKMYCPYHLYDSKASDRESIVNSVKAGLLACNSFRHPSRFWQWISKDRNFWCVTYSCATARDSHTIPY